MRRLAIPVIAALALSVAAVVPAQCHSVTDSRENTQSRVNLEVSGIPGSGSLPAYQWYTIDSYHYAKVTRLSDSEAEERGGFLLTGDDQDFEPFVIKATPPAPSAQFDWILTIEEWVETGYNYYSAATSATWSHVFGVEDPHTIVGFI